MKLQSLMDRGAAKEASNLLDIVRLTLDHTAGAIARQQLSSTDPQLRADSLLHVRLCFATNAARSLPRIKTVPEGRATTRDDIDLVGELLTGSSEGISPGRAAGSIPSSSTEEVLVTPLKAPQAATGFSHPINISRLSSARRGRMVYQ
jgi:hypothetical protein